MADARQPCCVPFCKRTVAFQRNSEWICGSHWRLTDRRLRRLYFAHQRKQKKFKPRTPEWWSHEIAAARIWQKLKGQAIEGAAGIR